HEGEGAGGDGEAIQLEDHGIAILRGDGEVRAVQVQAAAETGAGGEVARGAERRRRGGEGVGGACAVRQLRIEAGALLPGARDARSAGDIERATRAQGGGP